MTRPRVIGSSLLNGRARWNRVERILRILDGDGQHFMPNTCGPNYSQIPPGHREIFGAWGPWYPISRIIESLPDDDVPHGQRTILAILASLQTRGLAERSWYCFWDKSTFGTEADEWCARITQGGITLLQYIDETVPQAMPLYQMRAEAKREVS